MASIGDIPLLQAMRSRMEFHQYRQKVLANNVANASTPGFQPLDVKTPKYFANVTQAPMVPAQEPVVTSSMHIAGHSIFENTEYKSAKGQDFETTPDGNSVNVEDQMMKVTANQLDFQTVASLYQRGLGLIKIAAGKS